MVGIQLGLRFLLLYLQRSRDDDGCRNLEYIMCLIIPHVTPIFRAVSMSLLVPPISLIAIF